MTLVAVAAALCGSAAPAAAQPPAPAAPPSTGTASGALAPAGTGVITADEAVALAVRNNPRLLAVIEDVSGARAGVRSARALTNPYFAFVPSLFGTGSDEELLFQQPLELNGTRSARTGVARAQLRQTQAQALGELRALVFDTRHAYFELARTQELHRLAQQMLETARGFHHGVRRQAEEGLRPEIDPVQTQIEVSRAEQQLVLAESQVIAARAALNTLLGRPAGAPSATQLLAEVVPVSATPDAATPHLETLVARALAARSEIAGEAAARDRFRQEARLARAEGRPDLAPQVRSESVLRSPRQPGIGIGITLPFLDYGSRRNRVKQAEASVRAQEARIAAAQNQVRQDVEQAYARLQAAEQVVRSYQGGVLEQSRRLLNASLRALQLGAPNASILTALEAQRTYRGVLTEYTSALATVGQSRAALERAIAAVSADLLPAEARPAATEGSRTAAEKEMAR